MESGTDPQPTTASWVMVAIAWALVGGPLLWGVYNTFQKAVILFQ
jgi:hypothetical protein